MPCWSLSVRARNRSLSERSKKYLKDLRRKRRGDASSGRWRTRCGSERIRDAARYSRRSWRPSPLKIRRCGRPNLIGMKKRSCGRGRARGSESGWSWRSSLCLTTRKKSRGKNSKKMKKRSYGRGKESNASARWRWRSSLSLTTRKKSREKNSKKMKKRSYGRRKESNADAR